MEEEKNLHQSLLQKKKALRGTLEMKSRNEEGEGRSRVLLLGCGDPPPPPKTKKGYLAPPPLHWRGGGVGSLTKFTRQRVGTKVVCRGKRGGGRKMERKSHSYTLIKKKKRKIELNYLNANGQEKKKTLHHLRTMRRLFQKETKETPIPEVGFPFPYTVLKKKKRRTSSAKSRTGRGA